MKITEGRGRMDVLIDKLSLCLNNSDTKIDITNAFYVTVGYYYEDAIKGNEDEPPCDEYLEITSIRVCNPVFFTGYNGVTMTIDNRLELIDVLKEDQVEYVKIEMKKQSKGYVDNDDLRPPVSKRTLRELGHNLLGEYDWSEK